MTFYIVVKFDGQARIETTADLDKRLARLLDRELSSSVSKLSPELELSLLLICQH